MWSSLLIYCVDMPIVFSIWSNLDSVPALFDLWGYRMLMHYFRSSSFFLFLLFKVNKLSVVFVSYHSPVTWLHIRDFFSIQAPSWVTLSMSSFQTENCPRVQSFLFGLQWNFPLGMEGVWTCGFGSVSVQIMLFDHSYARFWAWQVLLLWFKWLLGERQRDWFLKSQLLLF